MPKSNKTTSSMLRRMMGLMLALVIFFLTFATGRLGYIMIVKSDFYQSKASEQQLYDTEIAATRGDIYDCNMNVLATSATVYTLYVAPNSIEKDETKAAIAQGLSQLVDVSYDEIYADCEKSTYYSIIKKQIEPGLATQIRQWIADNGLGSLVGLEESTKRYYPNGSLASVVLGFVGSDNQGLYGIESQYETQLKGVPGRVVAAKNARGSAMPFSYQEEIAATPGNSLVLTLDSYIQNVTEKYLEQAVEDNNVTERGVCIAMNVNTGEIMGMAVKGDFDPNTPFALTDEDQAQVESLEAEVEAAKQAGTYDESKAVSPLNQVLNSKWRNKAVSDPYEPGSVFKIITGAAALEEGVTDTSKSYFCPGYYVVAGQRYNCHKTTGHGAESLADAFSNSCNPVFITFGQLLGVHTFSHYYEAFGLTTTTGIDLPSEATSIYHSEENMGLVELASSSFGQTFKVTPIQLITAVAAAVNGGYLVQPHVVSEILDADGNVVKTVGTTVKRQVISKETSETLCSLLEGVVDGGGGKNAYVAGYRIGGKTGTSQKVADELQNSTEKLRIASFCGIAPINDPEIAVLVLLDEPHADNIYGGTIAAPVGGEILADVLPYLGYEPQYTDEQLAAMNTTVPGVVNKSLSQAQADITNAGLKVKVMGSGDTVLSQSPSEGITVSSENGVVVLYTDAEETSSTVTVPDFTGKSVSAVNSTASSYNINVLYSGTDLSSSGAVAYKQTVSSGTTVDAGTVVTVYFRTTDSSD